MTITSFPEIPLWMIEANLIKPLQNEPCGEEEQAVRVDLHKSTSDSIELKKDANTSYGATENSLAAPSLEQVRHLSLHFYIIGFHIKVMSCH